MRDHNFHLKPTGPNCLPKDSSILLCGTPQTVDFFPSDELLKIQNLNISEEKKKRSTDGLGTDDFEVFYIPVKLSHPKSAAVLATALISKHDTLLYF